MLIEDVIHRFKGLPPAPRLTDPDTVKRLYRQWRIRMMYSTFIGYALFYFCRKNISIALPALGTDLELTNVQLGLFGTMLYVVYGFGRFINGFLADKANPRYFMSVGLFFSALMNLFFGLSSATWCLALFWGLNGWFQSMGFPPCAKMLANWYSVSERGTNWAIWHSSHQLGGFIIAILAGFLVQHYGWRMGFYVPAALCFLTAIFLFNRLRDTPVSMGLPPIAEYHGEVEYNQDGTVVDDEYESIRHTLFHRVLNNKHIWLMSFMTLFCYIIRFGTFDWATKFLVEVKGSSIVKAGIVVSMIELVGILGPLTAGLITDKLWGGKRAPWCVICFLLTIVGLTVFYFVPPGNPYIDALALSLIGFFIYGPQFLQGPFLADLASRKAASTANGLAGVFSYAGAALSGVGTGYFLDTYGWGGGFAFWGVAALCGALISATLWNVKGANHSSVRLAKAS
ncbi:MAG: MFS transporter [Deltaproteobacteria bacterium]|nr:MFS transporter [Deltaproteobacteria bacterium]